MATPRASSSVASDVVGMSLVVVLACWVAFGAGGGTGRSGPVVALVGAIVVAVALGRAANRRHPCAVARVVAIGIAGSFAVTWPGALTAGGGPTGYGNTNATLAGLGVVAALLGATAPAALDERSGNTRRAMGLVAVALAGVVVATGSVAGVAVLGVSLGLVALSGIARWPGFAVVGTVIALLVALGVTGAIGRGGDPLGLADRDPVRTDLWRATVELVDEEPVEGIGPGAFADRGPSRDADLRWSHHEYLQVAAELGGVGLVLVLSLLGWAWVRLWRASDVAPAVASMTAAALAVGTIHATVDRVWHVPVVVLVVALLFGSGTAAAGDRRGENRSFGPIEHPSTGGYDSETVPARWRRRPGGE